MHFRDGIFVWLFVLIGTTHCFNASLRGEDVDVESFANEIVKLAETGYRSELLRRYVDALMIPTELQNSDWRTFTGHTALVACKVCKSAAKTLITMRQKDFTTEKIQEMLINLCVLLKIQKEHVCRGIIETQLPVLIYIVDIDPSIEALDICGLGLQSESCSTVSIKYDWKMKIDENPQLDTAPVDGDGNFKILQLTDIHYDPYYEPYGNALCGEPMCCRMGQNFTNTSGKVAGYWGDYNDCDLPWHTVVDVLDHVNATHRDIAYVYFTGDLIDHGIWQTSKESNINSIVKSYQKIKMTFANVAVYPIIGNHETHPVNVFAPGNVTDETLSTEWLYRLCADLWINYGWLPESTRETILRGGFYTVSPRKGHRVIALNNNICYTFNWWLILEPRDPSDQLRWLADTLLEAEKNGEYVHILAHVPTGSDTCYKTWSREYRRIVNRFAHIIKAQFNGHTHNDEFNVFYDLQKPGRAVNVAWNGGSITPFTYLNSNYKVYTVEVPTYGIVDIDTWSFNLTSANESPGKRPDWHKSYSFREEYSLQDLSADSLHKWIVDASRNLTMVEQYRRNFYKRADPALSLPCDENCLRDLLCTIVTTSSADDNPCGFLMS